MHRGGGACGNSRPGRRRPRSHSASVPSSRAKSGSVSRRTFSRPGACSASRWMTVVVWVVASLIPNPEPSSDLRQGGVLPQVHQCRHRTLRRTRLATPVALTGDHEHGRPLYERMRQVESGGGDDQRSPRALLLRRQTSRSTARGSCSLRRVGRHPIGGHLEEAHWTTRDQYGDPPGDRRSDLPIAPPSGPSAARRAPELVLRPQHRLLITYQSNYEASTPRASNPEVVSLRQARTKASNGCGGRWSGRPPPGRYIATSRTRALQVQH